MDDKQELRRQLANLLTIRQAHMDITDAAADFPAEHINTCPPGCEYTFWHLLEHIRICQRDILDYIDSDHYTWLTFPDDLWPARAAVTDPAGWQHSLDAFLADRQRLAEIVLDPAVDLFAPLPNSGESRHSILREINVIADHTAYHTGEFAILRGAMGLWKPG
ncbi:MAG: DinB family protein [Anaerolineaceae bacterium]|nr:DinB family protein [Anaerolineaceae bacterium]